MERNLEAILARLQERDYKLTPQRQLVVQTLLRNPEKHLSAEDVYHLVRQENPDIGLATVYRTLDLLSELDVLRKIEFGDGRTRYELREQAHHHHHLICTACGKVEEFGEDLLEALEEQVARQSGFRVTDHQVKFYGLCRACQEAPAQREQAF